MVKGTEVFVDMGAQMLQSSVELMEYDGQGTCRHFTPDGAWYKVPVTTLRYSSSKSVVARPLLRYFALLVNSTNENLVLFALFLTAKMKEATTFSSLHIFIETGRYCKMCEKLATSGFLHTIPFWCGNMYSFLPKRNGLAENLAVEFGGQNILIYLCEVRGVRKR